MSSREGECVGEGAPRYPGQQIHSGVNPSRVGKVRRGVRALSTSTSREGEGTGYGASQYPAVDIATVRQST